MSAPVCPLLDALVADHAAANARDRELERIVREIIARMEDGRLDRSEAVPMLMQIKASIEAGEDHHADGTAA